MFGQARPGFGSSTTAFGQNNQQSNTFGQSQNTGFGFGSSTPTPFGQSQTNSTFGSFGQTNPANPFGATPTTSAFGGTGTGGAFGSTNAFGGGGSAFGSTSSAPTAFGSSGTSGGGFGPSLNTGFGAGTTNAFGGTTPATSAFGSTNAFGTTAGQAGMPSNGTATPFQALTEKHAGDSTTSVYQSISAMPAYRSMSHEELRVMDYQQGRKNPANNGAFGIPSSTTTAFGAPTSNAFGTAAPTFGSGTSTFGSAQPNAFGAGSTTGAFGTPPTNTFGSVSQTSAFGIGATNTFGSTPSAFGSTQPATTSFGASNPTNSGAFSSSSSGAFGSTPTTSAFGAFGNTGNTALKPFGSTPTIGSFGSASTTPASTNTFGSTPVSNAFGGTQPTQTNAFGNVSTPATTTFGAFGSNTTKPTSTFGSFGSNQATPKPFTGFASTTTSSAPSNPFASAAPSQPTTSFSTAAQPASAFGATASLNNTFGASAFANSTTQHPFGSSALANSTLGGSTNSFLGAQTFNTSQSLPTLQASVDHDPYGNNSLFAGFKTSTAAQNLLTTSARKISPMMSILRTSSPSKSGVKTIRGFSSPATSAIDLSTSSLTSSNGKSTGKPSTPLKFGLDLGDDINVSPLAFQPRNSVKKLVIDRTITKDDLMNRLSTAERQPPASSKVNFLNKKSIQLDPNLETSVYGSPFQQNTFASADGSSSHIENADPLQDAGNDLSSSIPPSAATRHLSTQTTQSDSSEEDLPPQQSEWEIDMSLLKDGQYYTKPSLKYIASLRDVKGFTDLEVGRKGHGSVKFMRPVDLSQLHQFKDLLGKAIQFYDRSINVYPTGYTEQKPVVGEGINVPAIVRLEKCWPHDKATRDPIKDPQDSRVIKHVKRLKKMPGTNFIDYSADSGMWTFQVDHFSRYGLYDSADEISDTEEDDSIMHGEDDLPPRKSLLEGSEDESSFESRLSEPRSQDEKSDIILSGQYSKRDDDSGLETESDDDRRALVHSQGTASAYETWPRRLGLEPKRMAIMQTSFFPPTVLPPPPSEVYTAPTVLDAPSSEELQTGAREILPIRVSATKRYDGRHPAIPSAISTFVDAGLMLGRSFRANFSSKGHVIYFGKPVASSERRKCREVIIEKIADDIDSYSEDLLSVQLQNTTIDILEGVPQAFTHSSFRFGNLASQFSKEDISHAAIVYRLCEVLFDEIDLGFVVNEYAMLTRILSLRRSDNFSRWLEHTVAQNVEDLLAAHNNSVYERIFMLLTGNQVQRACNLCLESKNYHMATLLAQANSDRNFRSDIHLQLSTWEDDHLSGNVSPHVQKIYHLLKGTDPSQETRGVDVAATLDWKQALGLHFWYGEHETDIQFALLSYTKSLLVESTPKPVPWYQKDGKWEKRSDSIFELLQLYSNSDYPLEKVLSPRNFGPSPFDYSIPWHLLIIFSRTLKIRDVDDRQDDVQVNHDDDIRGHSNHADGITLSYACQLENAGAWEWAIFVLLHLELSQCREKAIKDVITRNIDIMTPQLRSFLVDELRIPHTWIHASTAIFACHRGDYIEKRHSLLRAGSQIAAHEMVVSTLAPEAVLRHDFKLLRDLLEGMYPNLIPGFSEGGRLFFGHADMVDGYIGSEESGLATLPRLDELAQRYGVNSLKLQSCAAELSTFVARNFSANAISTLQLRQIPLTRLHVAEQQTVVKRIGAMTFSESLKVALA